MLQEISGGVYQRIREYGGLSPEEVAELVGRRRQVVSRWESNKQMPKRDQEKILVEASKLSRLAFGEIICEVVGEFVGRPITIGASTEYVPSRVLLRAAGRYNKYRHDIPQDSRDAIEEMLAEGRSLDVGAERACRVLAKQIDREIDRYLAARKSQPPDDEDD